MRTLRLTLLGALAACVLLAACGGGGGGGVPEERPDDFALSFEYVAGSVPPPYHDEWTLEVGGGGKGTLAYTPDYSGDGVPVYRHTFDVDDAGLDEMYESLRSQDLLRDEFDGADEEEPVGGSVRTATIEAAGQSYEVPPFANGAPVISDPLLEQIHDLAPSPIWKQIDSKRKAYAAKEYPDGSLP